MNLKHGQHFGQWTLKGDEEIGAGGNGIVWLAENSEGTKGAIKFFNREGLEKRFSNKPDVVDSREKRFRVEIEFLTREGEHPGILRIIDSSPLFSSSKADLLWFVTPLAMPFTKLNLSGRNKFEDLVQQIEIFALTLAALHKQGKCHRDIHPGNFFLLNDKPVIGDFGLVDFPGKESLTGDTEPIGARDYIAPEMRRNAADAKPGPADVYSFAKTFWVLASGRSPEDGPLRIDIPELKFSNVCHHPRADQFDVFIEQATDHTPSRRPTMQEFADELSGWLKPKSIKTGAADLSALAKESESIFEVKKRKERNQKELIQAAEAILFSFNPVLSEIAIKLSAFTKKEVGIERGAYSDLLEKFHFVQYFRGVGLVWKGANQVKVAIAANPRVTVSLHCFAQVEALDNDTIRVVVGHFVQPIANGDLIKEAIKRRGSVQLENESKALGSELLVNLEPAIREFVDKLRKHPSD